MVPYRMHIALFLGPSELSVTGSAVLQVTKAGQVGAWKQGYLFVSWNGLRYGCVFVCKAVSFICQYSQRKFKVCVTWKLHPRETVSRDMLKACFGRQESCFLVGVLLVLAYFLYGRTYFWKKVKGVNCRCKHVRLPKCFRVVLRPTWQPIGTCVSEQT